jgi:uncharacterized protein YcfJ
VKQARAAAVATIAAALTLSACTQAPMGPTVGVMPGPNKPFSVFQEDQAICRQFAEQQVGGAQQAENTATTQTLIGAGVGTLLGAGLGAAIGGGRGAAIGAAAGAVGGTAVGASQAQGSTMSVQRRYDIAYEQCMYSRGNQVPGYVQPAPAMSPPPPPPPSGYPPPPPPPPPGYR